MDPKQVQGTLPQTVQGILPQTVQEVPAQLTTRGLAVREADLRALFGGPALNAFLNKLVLEHVPAVGPPIRYALWRRAGVDIVLPRMIIGVFGAICGGKAVLKVQLGFAPAASGEAEPPPLVLDCELFDSQKSLWPGCWPTGLRLNARPRAQPAPS